MSLRDPISCFQKFYECECIYIYLQILFFWQTSCIRTSPSDVKEMLMCYIHNNNDRNVTFCRHNFTPLGTLHVCVYMLHVFVSHKYVYILKYVCAWLIFYLGAVFMSVIQNFWLSYNNYYLSY